MQNNATDLEINIMKAYLSLPENIRDKVVDFFKENLLNNPSIQNETEETKPADGENQQSEAVETASMEAAKALSFQEKDNLGWPVAGNVLINYSMDKTVYFPTLQQYKYSPAIVIAAAEGENITSSADGKVLSVFEDAEIGQAVTVDIGNGYELTYGQLKDIMVLQGDIISSGDVIGKVAAPTKYYSVEGPNVYFRLTKDGRPVNPLSNLE
jgi:septal ring factor EnvC (AmiA/AmiB activator)